VDLLHHLRRTVEQCHLMCSRTSALFISSKNKENDDSNSTNFYREKRLRTHHRCVGDILMKNTF